jgi:hypothetical protein
MVAIQADAAVNSGEQVVPLRRERGNGAVALAEVLHDRILLDGEEPDRAACVVDLRGHRPGVAVLDTIEAEHHGHVGLESFPEPGLEFLRRRHACVPCWSLCIQRARRA